MWRPRRSRPANGGSLSRQRAGCCTASLAAGAVQKHRMHQPEQSTVLCIHRDRRVQVQAALIAVVAQTRRVLNYQHVPPFYQPSGAGMGGCYHLARRHAWIMQEPPKTNLARSVAAKWPDPNAVLADRNKTVQKEGPPFSRRRSPNRPSMCSISLPPTRAHSQQIREGASPQGQLGKSQKKMCACRSLTRPSTGSCQAVMEIVRFGFSATGDSETASCRVDGRVKPGHDGRGEEIAWTRSPVALCVNC